MNIRFAPDSVRVRISLVEAQALVSDGKLCQNVPFIEGRMALEVSLVAEQGEAAEFSFQEGRALTCLRKNDFLALLADKPSRESCIRSSLRSASDSPLDFLFEIDLLSRKEKRKVDHE